MKYALALSCLLLASPALAQEADPTARAAEQYDAATRAFESGEFAEAARGFERADAIAPHPRTRYNAALSWDQAGDAPRAADAYAAALEGQGLDAERVDAAKKRLSELIRKIGALDVRRPTGGTVSVAHAEKVAIPARIHVAPGVHRVVLERADGTRDEREVEVHAGERVVLEIAITTARLAPEPEPARPPPRPAEPPPPEPSNAQRTWGFVALGGATVFAAGAVYFGIQTFDAVDEFDASGDRDADARDRAVQSRALGWAAAGATVACATLGIVLLATADDEIAVGTNGSGVTARLRF